MGRAAAVLLPRHERHEERGTSGTSGTSGTRGTSGTSRRRIRWATAPMSGTTGGQAQASAGTSASPAARSAPASPATTRPSWRIGPPPGAHACAARNIESHSASLVARLVQSCPCRPGYTYEFVNAWRNNGAASPTHCYTTTPTISPRAKEERHDYGEHDERQHAELHHPDRQVRRGRRHLL